MWLSHNFSGILSANRCFFRWGNVSAQYFFLVLPFFLFEKIFFDFFCNKMVVLNFLIFYYKRSIYT